MIAEQAHMIDHRGSLVVRISGAEAFHHVGNVPVRQSAEQVPQLAIVVRIEAVVGVHPEDPRTPGMAETFIAGGREAIDPGEIDHAGPEAGRHGPRVIRGAGVHHDDFLHQVPNRIQALRETGLFILHDHAQRYGRRQRPGDSNQEF